MYVRLGESLWRSGRYAIDGIPYAKHLPLHPFLSYPFVRLTNPGVGMKLSSLLAGAFVLMATYLLLRRPFGSATALLATGFLLFHHGFILMTMLGSADLLFTALFLGSLAAFEAAGTQRRMYLPAGIFLGFACLTRYNGVLLFLVYPLFVFLKRPRDRTSGFFWGGILIASAIFGLWFARNAIVFGNPFYTDYTAEFHDQIPSVTREVLRNLRYYFNPLHNVLPVLLGLALWGLALWGKRRPLLLLGMLAGIVFALVWWVKGIRFAFPAYPILLGFSAVGAPDLWNRVSWRPILIGLAALTVFLHSGALCVYTYGQCNAWFDRTIGHIPPDLGLSSEGLYGISLARDYIDAFAPQGSAVLVSSINYWTWQTGVFRPDIHVVSHLKDRCPAYSIEQGKTDLMPLYTTESAPVTTVVLQKCT